MTTEAQMVLDSLKNETVKQVISMQQQIPLIDVDDAVKEIRHTLGLKNR